MNSSKEVFAIMEDVRGHLDALDKRITTAFKTVDALTAKGDKRASNVGLAIIGLRKATDHYHQTILGAFDLMLDCKCYIAAFSLRIEEYGERLKAMAKQAGIPEPEAEPVEESEQESSPRKPAGKKSKK